VLSPSPRLSVLSTTFAAKHDYSKIFGEASGECAYTNSGPKQPTVNLLDLHAHPPPTFLPFLTRFGVVLIETSLSSHHSSRCLTSSFIDGLVNPLD
jgi:hypothetical protein